MRSRGAYFFNTKGFFNMKRIISIALIVFLMLSFTGCANTTTAKWDGYDKTSFTILLTSGLEPMYLDKYNSLYAYTSVSVEDGWTVVSSPDGFIDTGDISKGAKPYTYVANVNMPYTINGDEITIRFFMELKGKLSVKGAQIIHNGVVQNLSAAETENYLHGLEVYYEAEMNR